MLRRKQTDSTKAKISQKMKQVHAGKTEAEKQATREKQSQTMKNLPNRIHLKSSIIIFW